MLPIPFKNFIPKIFRDDPKSVSLANKADSHLNEWENETLGLQRQIRTDECDNTFLDLLGFLLSANIQSFDSEMVKRRKVRDAVATHKKRGLWNADVKIRIDNITGLSPGSRILRWDFFFTSDWIWTDATPSIIPAAPSDYWASWGTDGIDNDTGIDWIGAGTEIEIAGNIYIDCHEGINVSTLTADEISQIVLELDKDVAPAYMRLFLGYIDATGKFVTYAGGIIG